MPTNTARIAKNTLMLYFRQILIMLVSLYTVRVVLETLGAEDYGIYNVVAGVVTMFGFLSNSMATSTQRFLSFEIGHNNHERLKKIFSISLVIYVLIMIMILLLAETVGLWFVNNNLTIPPERKSAAVWVYQFAVISFLFSILTSPYMAVIISHEDMNIYASISIFEAVLKLAIVFLLRLFLIDKLCLYGILTCAVTIINMVLCRTVCTVKYQECKFGFYWDKSLFREIMNYTGWSMFGSSASVLQIQGINIVVNQYFNSVVVASRSIALSINNATIILLNNFTMAARPQIIKSYASGDYIKTERIVFSSAKLMYFLMYIIALPMMLEMPFILSLWLKNVPEYTVVFGRLMVLETLANSITYSLSTVAIATGKIKRFNVILNGSLLLNIPISIIVLSFGYQPYSVFVVSLVLRIFIITIEFFIVKRIFNYSIKKFFAQVIFPMIFLTLAAFVLLIILLIYIQEGLLRLVLAITICFLVSSLCMYTIILNKDEKMVVRNYLGKYIISMKQKI
jgi:O-antigen/teichoic acid export membrane protein